MAAHLTATGFAIASVIAVSLGLLTALLFKFANDYCQNEVFRAEAIAFWVWLVGAGILWNFALFTAPNLPIVARLTYSLCGTPIVGLATIAIGCIAWGAVRDLLSLSAPLGVKVRGVSDQARELMISMRLHEDLERD
jgi:hypothetical protein